MPRLSVRQNWSNKLLGGLADLLILAGAGLFVLIFVGMIVDVLQTGWAALSMDFLLQRPTRAGRAGGIGPIIVSTAIVTSLALVIATPLAIGTGLFLTDYMRREGWLAGAIRQTLFVLSSVPSIIYGLVGNALFCDALGLGFSLLSGGLTLALMILPLMAAVAEQVFRAVPEHSRMAGYALGMPKRRVLWRIVLPQAGPGLLAAASLGVGRAMAESAALVFTSGYVDRMPGSLFDSGRVMAVHILDLAMNVTGGLPRANSTALVLLVSMTVIMGSLTLSEFYFRRKAGAH